MNSRVYFCYASRCPISQMFFRQLVSMFTVDTKTHVGTAIRQVDFFHVDMSNLGAYMPEQLETLVSESDAFVLLWSSYCYEGWYDGKSKNKSSTRKKIKIRDNIATELKALGKYFDKLAVLPVFIGDPLTDGLEKMIRKGVSGREGASKELEKSISKEFNKAIRLPVNEGGDYSPAKFRQDSMILYYSILDSLLVPFKVPKHFKDYFQRPRKPFLNDLLADYHGGIYFEIKNTNVDYAKALRRGLASARRSFFATLRKSWLEKALETDNLATPNFRYFQEVDSAVSKFPKSDDRRNQYNSFRLMIGDGDEDVRSYFSLDSGSVETDALRKFFDSHRNVEPFYINENALKGLLDEVTPMSVPDFAVLDDTLVIMSNLFSDQNHKPPQEVDKPADAEQSSMVKEQKQKKEFLHKGQTYGIVQSFLLDDHHDNQVIYRALKEIVTRPPNSRPKQLKAREDILDELGLRKGGT